MSDSECHSPDESGELHSSKKKRKKGKWNLSSQNKISSYDSESWFSNALRQKVQDHGKMDGEVPHPSRREKGKKKMRRNKTDGVQEWDESNYSTVSDSDSHYFNTGEENQNLSSRILLKSLKKSLENNDAENLHICSTREEIEEHCDVNYPPLKSNTRHQEKMKKKKRKTNEALLHDESTCFAVPDSEVHETRPNPLESVTKTCKKKRKSLENEFTVQDQASSEDGECLTVADSQEDMDELCIANDKQILFDSVDKGKRKRKEDRKKMGEKKKCSQPSYSGCLQNYISGTSQKRSSSFHSMNKEKRKIEDSDLAVQCQISNDSRNDHVYDSLKEQNGHCDSTSELFVANSGESKNMKRKTEKKKHEVSVSCCSDFLDSECFPMDRDKTGQKLSTNGLRKIKNKNSKRSLALHDKISSDDTNFVVTHHLEEESRECDVVSGVSRITERKKRCKRNEDNNLFLLSESTYPSESDDVLQYEQDAFWRTLTQSKVLIKGPSSGAECIVPLTDKVQSENYQRKKRKEDYNDRSSLYSIEYCHINTSYKGVESSKKNQNGSVSNDTNDRSNKREIHIRNKLPSKRIECIDVPDSSNGSEGTNVRSSKLVVCSHGGKYKAPENYSLSKCDDRNVEKTQILQRSKSCIDIPSSASNSEQISAVSSKLVVCESCGKYKANQTDSFNKFSERNVFKGEIHQGNKVPHEGGECINVSDSSSHSEGMNAVSSNLVVCKGCGKYKAAGQSGEKRKTTELQISESTFPEGSKNRQKNIGKCLLKSSHAGNFKSNVGPVTDDEECCVVFDSKNAVENKSSVHGSGREKGKKKMRRNKTDGLPAWDESNYSTTSDSDSQNEKKTLRKRPSLVHGSRSMSDSSVQVKVCERSIKFSCIDSSLKRKCASPSDQECFFSSKLQKTHYGECVEQLNKKVQKSSESDNLGNVGVKIGREKGDPPNERKKRQRAEKCYRVKENSIAENKHFESAWGSDGGIVGNTSICGMKNFISCERAGFVVPENNETIDVDSILDVNDFKVAEILDKGSDEVSERTKKQLVSKLIHAAKQQSKAPSELIEKMKHLQIVLIHDVPLSHKIESKPYDPPSDEERKLLVPFCMKNNYKFSVNEDRILKSNWVRFCQEYRFKDAVSFTSASNYLTSETRIKLCQYLGQGLPNRMLHQIYNRFRSICLPYNRGRFHPREDKLILLITKSGCETPNKFLSTLLNRPAKSISARYGALMDLGKVPAANTSLKCTPQLAELILKALVKVQSCSVAELRNRHISASVWRKVGEELKIPPSNLKWFWRYTLHYRLFAEKNYSFPTIAKKIIEWLHSIQSDPETGIRWGDYTHLIPGSTGEFLSSKFESLKRSFDASTFHSIRGK